jgi:hypothetical protein
LVEIVWQGSKAHAATLFMCAVRFMCAAWTPAVVVVARKDTSVPPLHAAPAAVGLVLWGGIAACTFGAAATTRMGGVAQASSLATTRAPYYFAR